MLGILLSLGLLYYIPLLIMEECRKRANEIHWSQVSRSCNKYPYTCPGDKEEKAELKPELKIEPEQVPNENEASDTQEEDIVPVISPLQKWVAVNVDYMIDILECQEESVTIPSEKLEGYDPEEILNWLIEKDNVALAMYNEEDESIHLAICDASRM